MATKPHRDRPHVAGLTVAAYRRVWGKSLTTLSVESVQHISPRLSLQESQFLCEIGVPIGRKIPITLEASPSDWLLLPSVKKAQDPHGVLPYRPKREESALCQRLRVFGSVFGEPLGWDVDDGGGVWCFPPYSDPAGYWAFYLNQSLLQFFACMTAVFHYQRLYESDYVIPVDLAFRMSVVKSLDISVERGPVAGSYRPTCYWENIIDVAEHPGMMDYV